YVVAHADDRQLRVRDADARPRGRLRKRQRCPVARAARSELTAPILAVLRLALRGRQRHGIDVDHVVLNVFPHPAPQRLQLRVRIVPWGSHRTLTPANVDGWPMPPPSHTRVISWPDHADRCSLSSGTGTGSTAIGRPSASL